MRAVSCSTLERTCAMLILEDDAVFHSKFLSSFRQLWSSVPDKWDNTFSEFCHVGTKQGVLETEQNSAYARRSRAAAKLMYYMPGDLLRRGRLITHGPDSMCILELWESLRAQLVKGEPI
jgi:hypothetical protein